MGFKISDLFSAIPNAIGSVTNGVGKFLYDAGIPDPMATAYANKQEADLKKQYYTLGQQKLAAELEKARKEADITNAIIPPELIEKYKKLTNGYTEKNADAAKNREAFFADKKMKSFGLNWQDFGQPASNTDKNNFKFETKPLFQGKKSYLEDEDVFGKPYQVGVDANGKLQISGGINSAELSKDKYKDEIYHPGMERYKVNQMPEFAPLLAKLYQSNEMPWLMRSGEENVLASRIAGGLDMNAKDKAEHNLKVAQAKMSVFKDVIDNIRQELDSTTQYGRDAEQVKAFVNNTRMQLAAIGLDPNMIEFANSPYEGVAKIRLNNDIWANNQKVAQGWAHVGIAQQNADTNAARADAYIKNLDKEKEPSFGDVRKANDIYYSVDPQTGRQGGFLGDLAMMKSMSEREKYYNANKDMIWTVGHIAGKTDEEIANHLEHLGLGRVSR